MDICPELCKNFQRIHFLIEKRVPFHWDDMTQKDFDALKNVLVRVSLLYPPYQRDYFLYLITVVHLCYAAIPRR